MSYYMCKPVFGIGARVRVIRQKKYQDYNLVGLIGTVRTDNGGSITVLFDSITNHRSQYGCFYFTVNELIKVDDNTNESKEDKNMNKITNYLNVAKVASLRDSRANPQVYSYANFITGLTVGDLVVVHDNDDKYMTVCRVVDIEECNDTALSGEVVCKLDTIDYDTRVQARIKAAELKAKMEALAKQLRDVALYRMLAETNPDMAALLEEYQGLTKV